MTGIRLSDEDFRRRSQETTEGALQALRDLGLWDTPADGTSDNLTTQSAIETLQQLGLWDGQGGSASVTMQTSAPAPQAQMGASDLSALNQPRPAASGDFIDQHDGGRNQLIGRASVYLGSVEAARKLTTEQLSQIVEQGRVGVSPDGAPINSVGGFLQRGLGPMAAGFLTSANEGLFDGARLALNAISRLGETGEQVSQTIDNVMRLNAGQEFAARVQELARNAQPKVARGHFDATTLFGKFAGMAPMGIAAYQAAGVVIPSTLFAKAGVAGAIARGAITGAIADNMLMAGEKMPNLPTRDMLTQMTADPIAGLNGLIFGNRLGQTVFGATLGVGIDVLRGNVAASPATSVPLPENPLRDQYIGNIIAAQEAQARLTNPLTRFEWNRDAPAGVNFQIVPSSPVTAVVPRPDMSPVPYDRSSIGTNTVPAGAGEFANPGVADVGPATGPVQAAGDPGPSSFSTGAVVQPPTSAPLAAPPSDVGPLVSPGRYSKHEIAGRIVDKMDEAERLMESSGMQPIYDQWAMYDAADDPRAAEVLAANPQLQQIVALDNEANELRKLLPNSALNYDALVMMKAEGAVGPIRRLVSQMPNAIKNKDGMAIRLHHGTAYPDIEAIVLDFEGAGGLTGPGFYVADHPYPSGGVPGQLETYETRGYALNNFQKLSSMRGELEQQIAQYDAEIAEVNASGQYAVNHLKFLQDAKDELVKRLANIPESPAPQVYTYFGVPRRVFYWDDTIDTDTIDELVDFVSRGEFPADYREAFENAAIMAKDQMERSLDNITGGQFIKALTREINNEYLGMGVTKPMIHINEVLRQAGYDAIHNLGGVRSDAPVKYNAYNILNPEVLIPEFAGEKYMASHGKFLAAQLSKQAQVIDSPVAVDLAGLNVIHDADVATAALHKRPEDIHVIKNISDLGQFANDMVSNRLNLLGMRPQHWRLVQRESRTDLLVSALRPITDEMAADYSNFGLFEGMRIVSVATGEQKGFVQSIYVDERTGNLKVAYSRETAPVVEVRPDGTVVRRSWTPLLEKNGKRQVLPDNSAQPMIDAAQEWNEFMGYARVRLGADAVWHYGDYAGGPGNPDMSTTGVTGTFGSGLYFGRGNVDPTGLVPALARGDETFDPKQLKHFRINETRMVDADDPMPPDEVAQFRQLLAENDPESVAEFDEFLKTNPTYYQVQNWYPEVATDFSDIAQKDSFNQVLSDMGYTGIVGNGEVFVFPGLEADVVQPIGDVLLLPEGRAQLPRLFDDYIREKGIDNPAAAAAIRSFFDAKLVQLHQLSQPGFNRFAEQAKEGFELARTINEEAGVASPITIYDLAKARGFQAIPGDGDTILLNDVHSDAGFNFADEDAAAAFLNEYSRDLPIEDLPGGIPGEILQDIPADRASMARPTYQSRIEQGYERLTEMDAMLDQELAEIAVEDQIGVGLSVSNGPFPPTPTIPPGGGYGPSNGNVGPNGGQGGAGNAGIPPQGPPPPQGGTPGAGQPPNPGGGGGNLNINPAALANFGRKHYGDLKSIINGFAAKNLTPTRTLMAKVEEFFYENGLPDVRPWQAYSDITHNIDVGHDATYNLHGRLADNLDKLDSHAIREGVSWKIFETPSPMRQGYAASKGVRPDEVAAIENTERELINFFNGRNEPGQQMIDELKQYVRDVQVALATNQLNPYGSAQNYPSIGWFVEHAKSNHLYLLNVDMAEVTHNFIDAWAFNRFVEPSWNTAKQLTRVLQNTVLPDGSRPLKPIGDYMDGWMETVRRGYTPGGDVLLEAVHSTVNKVFALSKAEASDLINGGLGMMHRSALGWRPWTIIRDSTQPLMAVPRVGAVNLAEAYHAFLRDPVRRAQMIKDSAERGILQRGIPPIEGLGLDIQATTLGTQVVASDAAVKMRSILDDIRYRTRDLVPTKLRTINGTKLDPLWLYTSQGAMSRVILGDAAMRNFDKGWARHQEINLRAVQSGSPGQTMEEFVNHVAPGMEFAPRREIWERLAAGDVEGAKTVYARETADEFLFRYGQKEVSPGQRTHTARMVWQFGSYVNQNTNNLWRQARNAAKQRRADYIVKQAAWVAGWGALMYQISEETGWDVRKFAWWDPRFEGGFGVELVGTLVEGGQQFLQEMYADGNRPQSAALRTVTSPEFQSRVMDNFNPFRGLREVSDVITNSQVSPDPTEALLRGLMIGDGRGQVTDVNQIWNQQLEDEPTLPNATLGPASRNGGAF